MDGSTTTKVVDVQEKLHEIKARMPLTYREIQAKAGVIGRGAFGFVRRGVQGEANQFYAIEAGRVVGTPFDLPDVSAELAQLIVQFGCGFLVMWSPDAQKGGTDGQA